MTIFVLFVILAALVFGAVTGFGVQLFRAGRRVHRWYPTLVGGGLAAFFGCLALASLAFLAV